MIDEKKLIENLSSLNAINEHESHLIDEVFDIVNSQQKIGEWILCSEQLPERYKNVLVYWRRYMSDDCNIDILFMNENNEFLNDFRKINGVPLAWMPLPEPFKG